MFGMRKKRVSLEQKKNVADIFCLNHWMTIGWLEIHFKLLCKSNWRWHNSTSIWSEKNEPANWQKLKAGKPFRTNAIRLVRDRNASVWREIQTFGARSERDKINAKIFKFCWTTSTTATSWSRTRCQSLMGVRPTPPWWGRYRLEWPARSWPSKGSCGSPSPAWTSVSWWERI